nr:heparinase II/III family protein [Clostridia bacterium]
MKKYKIPYISEETKQQYIEDAEKYLGLDYEFIRASIPSQEIPRTFGVTTPQTIGCLECGRVVMTFGNYPYKADYINNQWKLICPACGLTFPTNDFKAYYEGGLDENGFFDPDLAKAHNDALIAKGEKGNLVNILYPEKGETWGVDAGTGYTAENGVTYRWIGYYHHFLWRDYVIPFLKAMRNAYIVTGDVKYANKLLVMLDRIADVYPDMTLDKWQLRDGYLNSDGGCDPSNGKIQGSIWETGLANTFLKSYMLIGPDILSGKLDDAVKFLCTKKPAKASAQDVYDNIMKGIVDEIYPAVKEAKIHGNTGMHQSTLALAAVIKDRMPETGKWLDFVFRTGGESRFQKDDGGLNVSSLLVNSVDRDGYGTEASAGYNYIWITLLLEVADILDGYELEGMENRDMFKHPKFRKMFDVMYQQIISDIYTAKIGDNASCSNPGIIAKQSVLLKGFLKFGNPDLARAAFHVANNDYSQLELDGFDEAPDVILAKVKAVIDEYGTLNLKGTNLTGYGFAALRDGNYGDMFDASNRVNTNQRSLTVYYGRNTGHGHKDTLNIAFHAHGLDLIPDMGYPRYADSLDKHRTSLNSNTISHNTVMIDSKKQTPQVVGDPLHYDYSDRVKLIDVASESTYTEIADIYRRTGALIRIDEDNSYVVDLFRVSGGSRHCYLLHGGEHDELKVDGLKLVKQADKDGNYIGTYAGPDTEYPINCDIYDETGSLYLFNIDKQTEDIGDFTADYSLLDTWDVLGKGMKAKTDVHVKLHMLTDGDGAPSEVTFADMRPPETKHGNPYSLRNIMVIREGENVKSCFASVIESYKGERLIKSVESLDVYDNGTKADGMEARAIKVTLENGRVDRIVNAVDTNKTYTVKDGDREFTFKGFYGVWTTENGRDSYYLCDGTQLGAYANADIPAVTGTVADFSRELAYEYFITVKANEAVDPAVLAGRMINIESGANTNAAYMIESAEAIGDGM